MQQHGSLCSSIRKMLHCGAGLTMQAGLSPDIGLPGASGQGLPGQGMLHCVGAFCIHCLTSVAFDTGQAVDICYSSNGKISDCNNTKLLSLAY